ncbi:FAD dependent oxidoreductase (plasmid) [Gemmatirosa kalamazoonensis]|uniref:FAD dependent oxidoreductase n=1 Tax=Gemmatirosa kalamazoonensis TaxID=861299 RepID=W0RS43_9BACT|nr:FAD-dependent oxidoreductase [Gemmatirosa kalamazoonensis]AHG92413.1 FAD dependent oxidoreductase [Gemmatirosa kalamazoonensis]
MRPDAIVVGAGIVGAACARELARDGRKVLVLDASFASSGTTAAGMGHLVVMDDSPEQLALTSLSVSLWRELAPSLPPSVEYEPCGTVWVAADESQLAAVRAKRDVYASAGIASEVLGPRELAAVEPYLRPGLAGGLLVPGDAVVYQPRATTWLLEQARASGAVVREGCRVDAITERAVVCAGETLRADVIVNAAGAEAARLTPELPIVPRKGHLAITDRYPGTVRHQLVELGYLASAHVMTTESVAFNVQPRATGQLLVGSSRELVGWDGSINRSVLRRMLDRAAEFLPTLADLSVIRTWTGFRPATPDKLPLIGAWPAIPGMWIAAGHEGLGIAMALGTARLLADLVAGRTPPIDAAPFAPSRVLDAATMDEASHAGAGLHDEHIS